MNNEIKKIISLIDLTSLNTTDTNDVIKQLVQKSHNQQIHTAAVCVYKEFVDYAKTIINPSILIATVVNFPSGESSLSDVLFELNSTENADEIDLVMPYKSLIRDVKNAKDIEIFITNIKKHINNKTLKVIIESGELKTEELIKLATKIAISSGADFVKTSTGKVPTNATLSSCTYILNEIKSHNKLVGFKIAGGVKTLSDALEYLSLVESIMGLDYINKKTLRFGASSLLDNLLQNTATTNGNY